MSITKIEPEKWTVDLICPNCGRSYENKGTLHKEGTGHFIKVNLPTFCIFCEFEKEKKRGGPQ